MAHEFTTEVSPRRGRPVKNSCIHRLNRAYRGAIDVGAALGAACIGFTVVAYAYEVVGRYFFDAPSFWVNATSVYLLLVSSMLVLPYVTREKQHVSIDFLKEVLPRSAHNILAVVLIFASAMICFVAAYFALEEVIRQFTRGVRTTDIMQLPKWWLTSFVVYGLANTAVIFFAQFITTIKTSRDGGRGGV